MPLLLNFSHPMTPEQIEAATRLIPQPIERIVDVSVQIEPLSQAGPLSQQIAKVVDRIGLSSHDWQAHRIIINPPGYSPAGQVLLAELHGRMGHFPDMLVLERVSGVYVVAALEDLQRAREQARRAR